MLKGLLKSKTALGLALGIILILIDSTQLLVLPELIGKIVGAISGALVIFGLMDAAKQEKDSIIAKVGAFVASSPFFGYLVGFISYTLDQLPTFTGLPEWVLIVGQILGAIMVVLGLRQANVQGRLTRSLPSKKHLQKYQGS